MIAKIFKLECLTNLHVGNGDVNFNIIDNEVEKDAVTKYPTINSSGVKGALREYMQCKKSDKLQDIFGGEGDGQSGKIKFLSANMLAIPMRASRGNAPYYLVTTEKAVELFNKLNDAFGCNVNLNTEARENGGTVEVEGVSCRLTDGLGRMGLKDVAVMDGEHFKNIPLPVAARNCLEEEKRNLWYEEIVPHESVFTFILIANDDNRELLNEFAIEITAEPIQFGGNATVGYGLCRVSEVGGNK